LVFNFDRRDRFAALHIGPCELLILWRHAWSAISECDLIFQHLWLLLQWILLAYWIRIATSTVNVISVIWHLKCLLHCIILESLKAYWF